MSSPISTAFVQQYSTNIQMLLQQQGSRLAGAVMNNSFLGKAASVVEQFGSVSPTYNVSRHGDTPYSSTPQDKRWAYPVDADWADLVDQQDKLRMLIDPVGPYTMAGTYAMGRGKDDAILAGLFQSNNTGENGTSATGLLSAYNSGSQVIGATVGAAGNTGLNVAKLRAAKKLLLAAEVDVDNDPLYMAITAQQNDDLLAQIQINSTDFNDRPVLAEGKVMRFMGFNFIHSERIPGGSKFATSYPGNSTVTGYTLGSTWLVPFWAKSGITLGTWNDITATVDRLPAKRNSWQIYVTGTFGATRNEELRCGMITCY